MWEACFGLTLRSDQQSSSKTTRYAENASKKVTVLTHLSSRQVRIADVLCDEGDHRVCILKPLVDFRSLHVNRKPKLSLAMAIVLALVARENFGLLVEGIFDIFAAFTIKVRPADVHSVITVVDTIIEVAGGGVGCDLACRLWSRRRQGDGCQKGSCDSCEMHIGLLDVGFLVEWIFGIELRLRWWLPWGP